MEPIESIWSGSTYSEEVQLESHWESKIQTLVLEYDRSVCAHTVITARSNTQLHPLGKFLTLLARQKMTKRVFVTVGTTTFDELIQAATEDKFLKVCYVETSVHVFCVHNEQFSHSTLKMLWLGQYPVCSVKVGWDGGGFPTRGRLWTLEFHFPARLLHDTCQLNCKECIYTSNWRDRLNPTNQKHPILPHWE